jgi:4-diphosphocytidyl-2-C-methyl-D-erythritol kinase
MTLRVATAKAPAKLNLFLHILGRRPDGYHELQTVFQLIDLRDEVRIESTDDGVVAREPAPTSDVLARLSDDQDLTVRAARAMQTALREQGRPVPGARVHVTKRIPAGGGLGGGSSDAATTLCLLNRLWDVGLDTDALCRLALPLGADVPFFVLGRNAWGEGRGERLTPVELPESWFVVVDPRVAVSTAAVFADAELTRDSSPLTMRDLDGASLQSAGLRNDCEAVVRRRHPEVAAALADLGRHGRARLTGTGGCVFAVFPDEPAARAAASGLDPRWRVFTVRGLAASSC